MVLHIVLPEPLQGRIPDTDEQQEQHGPPKVLYCNKKLWLTRPSTVQDNNTRSGTTTGSSGRMDEQNNNHNHNNYDCKISAGPGGGNREREVGGGTPPRKNTDACINFDTCQISKAQKKALFKGYLTIILSCIYAIFILMLGVVVYIADLISRTAILAEVFSVYLVALGLSWLIFLYFDIRRHQNKIRNQSQDQNSKATDGDQNRNVASGPTRLKTVSSSVSSSSAKFQGGEHGNLGRKYPPHQHPNGNPKGRSNVNNANPHSAIHLELPFPPFNRHAYVFCRSRHSGSFYLKIGAAGFCFGHLIHSGLLLCRQIIFFVSDDERVYNRCANVANLILDVLFPIYSVFLLFVIFKYSNVIINRHKELSRFALMHCISSSLCFWFWSILRETADSLYHKMAEGNSKNGSSGGGGHDNHHSHSHPHPHSHPQPHYEALKGGPGAGGGGGTGNLSESTFLPLTAYAGDTPSVFDFLNASSAITTFYDPCVEFSSISELVVKMSPYLYPFSIEFSILTVGVLFIMWQNIGKGYDTLSTARRDADHNNNNNDNHHAHNDPRSSPLTSFTNQLVIHADCHAANKGLFAGLLILVGTVISVIIFYIALDDFRSGFAAQWVNLTSQAVLLVIMIITVLCVYRQITKLDVNMHAVSLLDDLLLFLCLPSFFLYTIFTVVPAMAHHDYYAIVVCSLQVIQVILQTPCIIDGLRRCSNSDELRRTKPGRELVTFLIICNLAMWLVETFEIKSVYAQHEQISFYGSILWTLLSHMTLPLTLFYRFHSSVCLVDIWASAYESTSA